ncbi:MAG: AAA family ATPase [Ignavibacteria bacterium]|nr:AAA family ATPase [Ignavibacteria bacterium]
MSRSSIDAQLQIAISHWKNGKGAVVFLSAEAGMGKSHVLDLLEEQLQEAAVRVDCRPPIGSFNVASIQPLQPFGHAIERLYTKSEQAAKKRLALNIGMSVLASIPIAGDLFYAVKAISQDVNEYKRDTAALSHKKRAAVDECISMLKGVAQQTPFVLLIDDGHWCDPQSIEVLKQLIDITLEIPLLIVWAYTSTTSHRINLPLTSLLSTEKALALTINIPALTADEMSDFVASVNADSRFTSVQLTELKNRTSGIPGIIVEYVKYLQTNGQIKADGTIDEQALSDNGLKLSTHPATDILIHEVSEEDGLTLAMCASEGKEFTVFVMSQLLNIDIISAIRLLRRIQNETGFIKSIGVRTRYGVKTTAYEFTQSFAYTYFLHFPEYEERKLIHQRIAQILTDQYTVSQLPEIQHQIAALIAAHSAEADDTETTRRMLHESADAADEIGATDVAEQIRTNLLPQYELPDEFDLLNNVEQVGSAVGEFNHSTSASDIIRQCADSLLTSDHATVSILTSNALANNSSFTNSERATLHCLSAKASILSGDLANAQVSIDKAWLVAKQNIFDECVIHNVHATLYMATMDFETAKLKLQAAASLCNQLGAFSKVLTLSNITILLRLQNDKSADRYERTLRRLLLANGWQSIRTDLTL